MGYAHHPYALAHPAVTYAAPVAPTVAVKPTPIMPTPVEPYILSNVTLKLNPKLKLKLAPNLGITDITDILTDGEDITEDGVDITDDDGDTDIGVKPSD